MRRNLEMDPLTKSLIVTSWGNFGMGVVHRDEKLTEKDKVVHNVKKGMKSLKDGFKQGVSWNETESRIDNVNRQWTALNAIDQREYSYLLRRLYHEDNYLRNSVFFHINAPEARVAARVAAAEDAKKDVEEREKKEEGARDEAERAVKEEQDKAEKKADLAKQAADEAAAKKVAQKELNRLQREAAETRRYQRELELALEESLKTWKEEQQKRDEDLAKEARDKAIAFENAAKEEKRLAEEKKQREIDEKNATSEADRKQAEKDREDAAEAFKKATGIAEKARREAAEQWERYVNMSNEEKRWRFEGGWREKWKIVDVPADGDCLLHALCHFQKPFLEDCHKTLRKDIVKYIKDNLDDKNLFDGDDAGGIHTTFETMIEQTCAGSPGETSVWGKDGWEIPSTVERYLELMSKEGTYCTEIEIKAYEKMSRVEVHRTMEFGKVVVNIPPFNPPAPGDPLKYYVYYQASGQGGHYQALQKIP